MIADFRERSKRSLNVNVFCHPPAKANATLEAAWISRLGPRFAEYGASPPVRLTEIYRSFLTNDLMLSALVAEKPRIVSFHFGLPPAESVRALREAGIVLIASVTDAAEGRAAAAAGMQAVIAQGYEAGGHRGTFDPDAPDDCLGTVALTRQLVKQLPIPAIAAGGMMDGAGIAAALRLGAAAAQLGTAFIGCPESDADSGYRQALFGDAASHTVMTRAISGRPARCLQNEFTQLGQGISAREIPAYPIAYAAGKALHAAAKARGNFSYGAQWAGQGAPLARSMPAAELVAALVEEMRH
jgi:nitronate monooxygenase